MAIVVRFIAKIPVVFMILLLAGCSSFSREWRAVEKQAVDEADITGRWEGTWLSDVNGHNGRLRCIVTQDDAGQYEAWYHAKYRRILSFAYSVPLEVARANDRYEFEGQADLGTLAGGLYRYEGHATGKSFYSTYRAEADHGTFQMTRPKVALKD